MPIGHPNNPAPEPDRLQVFPRGIPSLGRMEDVRREIEGETCGNCGGRIVHDQTPSYVFKSLDICHCGQENDYETN